MNESTLEALRGSIAKWEAIVDGTGINQGTQYCPLCAKFYDDGCIGCPVMKKTGYWCCENSPYDAWVELEIDTIHDHPDAKRLAQAELDFLQSLLP